MATYASTSIEIYNSITEFFHETFLGLHSRLILGTIPLGVYINAVVKKTHRTIRNSSTCIISVSLV